MKSEPTRIHNRTHALDFLVSIIKGRRLDVWADASQSRLVTRTGEPHTRETLSAELTYHGITIAPECGDLISQLSPAEFRSFRSRGPRGRMAFGEDC